MKRTRHLHEEQAPGIVIVFLRIVDTDLTAIASVLVAVAAIDIVLANRAEGGNSRRQLYFFFVLMLSDFR